jgi:preprotein translocase subunit SecG
VDIILLVVHVLLAFGIITLVLLQKGKGAAEGATFGGGGAGSVFGASGSSNFLSKTTGLLATLFFANSIALAYLAANRDVPDSIVDSFTQTQQSDADVVDTLESLIPALEDAIPAADDADVPPPADATLSGQDAGVPAAAGQ